MALPLILSFFCIAYNSLPLCLSCLPFALTSVKITTNLALDASVLSLVIKVGVNEALNFNIGALFKANSFLFKTSNCRVNSLKAFF